MRHLSLFGCKGLSFLIVFSLMLPLCSSGQTSSAQSVLAEGDFYKLGIPKAGVYRIDREFLKQIGLGGDELNLSQVQVYTHFHGMLPQANDAPTVDDLVEIPLYQSSKGEVNLQTDDYILFYAEGPGKTELDTLNQAFFYEKNLYDTLHYVFLTSGRQPGKRIESQPSIIYGDGKVIRSFDDFVHFEEDRNNLLQSGRQWFGRELWEEASSQEISFELPGLVSYQNITLRMKVASKATSKASFRLDLNGENIATLEADAAQPTTFGYKARTSEETFVYRMGYQPDARQQLRIDFDGGGFSGYLDYISLQVQRELQLYGDQTAFRALESMQSRISEYRIAVSKETQLQIWDVSQPLLPQLQQYNRFDEEVRFKVYNDYDLREYVLLNQQTDLPRPLFIEKTKAQNLHALPTPELLIVGPEAWISEARRLAAFRRSHDGLDVGVVALPQVYNEFSAGRQDVSAIRNFIRMLYNREQGLKYVLLFGDASYDYLDRLNQNTNQIPTYQSHISTHDVHSYASDDYFGFLEAKEGSWPESGNYQQEHTLDIGIGRLPVNSLGEARQMVDKLIHYSSSPHSYGKWRNRVLFVADDGDDNKHQLMSDQLARYAETHYPQLLSKRLFLDAFPQEEYSAPEFKKALEEEINQGVLLVDFIGHGGETAWTNEQVLEIQQIKEWKNLDHLPLLLTATCEFGRFDDPRRSSGAEVALLQPDGGAIGLLTTTRPVFPGTNFKVSTAFYQHAFQPIEDGSLPRLGDIFRMTKNSSISGLSNRNFSLLGDPSMQLAMPGQEVKLEGIFSEEGEALKSIRPLQPFTLKGYVSDTEANPDEAFDGTAYISVYDKKESTETLGSEGPQSVMQYEKQERLLFQGKAKIRNGQFSALFMLPKNIEVDPGKMKVLVYALHEDESRDASGSLNDILLGGDPVEVEDQNGPDIHMYLNHRQFRDGDPVHPEPTLIAEITDENGINITEGRHGIRATVAREAWGPYALGSYFESDTDDFSKGHLSFTIKDLPLGEHVLTLEASDNALNRSQRQLRFTLTADSVLIFHKLLAYPNPSPNGDFKFSLSFAPQQLDNMQMQLLVYDKTGSLIADTRHQLSQLSQDYVLEWQGSTYGLRPGMYLYRLMLNRGSENLLSDTGKLIVR